MDLDSEWSGCYFELTDLEVADVFFINTDSSSSFPFGAYLYTTSAIRQDTICSQLGMPKILPSQLVRYILIELSCLFILMEHIKLN